MAEYLSSLNLPDIGTYFSNIASAPVNLVADLLLLFVFLFFVFRGARRGFVRSAFALIKPIGTILIAVFLCRPIGEFLFQNHMFDGMVEAIKEAIFEIVNAENFQNEHAGQTVVGFSGILGVLFSLVGNNELVDKLTGIVTGNPEAVTEVAESITSAAAVVITFVVLLILGGLIMKVVASLLNLICKLPGLNFINKLLGFLFGIVIGAVIAWLLSYVVFFIFTWLGGENMNISFFTAFGDGSGTYIQQFLYHFNPIQYALTALEDALIFVEGSAS